MRVVSTVDRRPRAARPDGLAR